MAQGVSVRERTGNQVRAKSLLLRWAIFNRSTATLPIYWRVLVGIDYESVGTTPTGAELFYDETSILSPLNIDETRGRFKILRDKFFATGPITVSTYQKVLKMYIPLHHKCEYAGAAANTSLKGALFYFIMSSPTAGTEGSFSVYTRFRFQDA